MNKKLDVAKALTFAEQVWEREIVPALTDYIRIPNKSQLFDPEWREHGHMDRAVALIESWCKKQPISGLVVETHRLPGRAPVILMEIPALGALVDGGDTVLLYGTSTSNPR
jgi:hypothetical protein